jgi:hypothetical protein
MDYGAVITVEAKRKERAACYELYERLGGAAWTSSRFPADSHSLTTRWCTDGAPLSHWHGVLTDGEEEGYITQIDLSNNNLEGTLEMAIPSLQHLSRLTNLFLSGNPKLTGPLPNRILDLPALSILGQLFPSHETKTWCFCLHVVFSPSVDLFRICAFTCTRLVLYFVTSCLVSFYLFLSCLVLSCFVVCSVVWSCAVLPRLFFSRLVLCCVVFCCVCLVCCLVSGLLLCCRLLSGFVLCVYACALFRLVSCLCLMLLCLSGDVGSCGLTGYVDLSSFTHKLSYFDASGNALSPFARASHHLPTTTEDVLSPSQTPDVTVTRSLSFCLFAMFRCHVRFAEILRPFEDGLRGLHYPYLLLRTLAEKFLEPEEGEANPLSHVFQQVSRHGTDILRLATFSFV